MHYVILGNGVAGMEAALALRKRDAKAEITLISAEHDHFFSRTALMYVFCGQLSLKDTEPYDRELYSRMRFTRKRGRMRHLDAAHKKLQFEDQSTLSYDKLLLCVGSKGRPAPWPGAEGAGLHYFVSLQDLEALDRQARSGMRAVVVGGGLIGVEVAEVLKQRGLSVQFVIREPWYFPVALDAREAAVVAEHVRGHGLEVRLGASVAQVLREGGALKAVQLETGEQLPADLVVAAIGVVPNTDFLRDSGIQLSAETGAIVVDASLKTSLPDVWAAGDCANVMWLDGKSRPEQLWYTARDQGRVAGAVMFGETLRYRRSVWYNSAKFFDMEYTTAGYIPPSRAIPPTESWSVWYQEDRATGRTQRIVLKEDRVVGFNCLGSRWDHQVFLRWIQEKRALSWVLEHMNEARFDEEFMPPFRVGPHAIFERLE